MIFADEQEWRKLGHRMLDVAEKAIAAYQERTDAEAHSEVEKAANIKTSMDSIERLLKSSREADHGGYRDRHRDHRRLRRRRAAQSREMTFTSPQDGNFKLGGLRGQVVHRLLPRARKLPAGLARRTALLVRVRVGAPADRVHGRGAGDSAPARVGDKRRSDENDRRAAEARPACRRSDRQSPGDARRKHYRSRVRRGPLPGEQRRA